ncbi:hypothetical protein [Glaciihabitans sp. dw_435]|uniref:hypothetical protein n=1 Tax=Glaciihabitans sp. dw_435 TaxID=2720081 RepID=UPI001BD5322C|nr:hypothetical protein [Glaciihabitans sp. dw_435]
MKSALPALKRSLIYNAWLALGIAVVGSIVGWFVAGGAGVASALVGTAMAAVFLGITAASIIVASKPSRSDMLSPAFFGIIMGGWLVKFVIFLVLVFILKDQAWVQSVVLFLSIVVAVIGSLVVDVLVVTRARVPYVDVALPGSASTGGPND